MSDLAFAQEKRAEMSRDSAGMSDLLPLRYLERLQRARETAVAAGKKGVPPIRHTLFHDGNALGKAAECSMGKDFFFDNITVHTCTCTCTCM